MHATVSGCGDEVFDEDWEAIAAARLLLSYLPDDFRSAPARRAPPREPERDDWDGLVPEDPNASYDVRDVDRPARRRRHRSSRSRPAGRRRWSPASPASTAASSASWPTSPRVRSGAIFVDSADKAARFVSLCDAFNVPLVFLQDVPGFMVGVEVERQGIIRHGAKMIAAMASAEVPKFTVVLRKAYAAGYYAMCAPGFEPRATLALPTATIGPMGAAGLGQRRVRQQDRRHRGRRRARRVRRRPHGRAAGRHQPAAHGLRPRRRRRRRARAAARRARRAHRRRRPLDPQPGRRHHRSAPSDPPRRTTMSDEHRRLPGRSCSTRRSLRCGRSGRSRDASSSSAAARALGEPGRVLGVGRAAAALVARRGRRCAPARSTTSATSTAAGSTSRTTASTAGRRTRRTADRAADRLGGRAGRHPHADLRRAGRRGRTGSPPGLVELGVGQGRRRRRSTCRTWSRRSPRSTPATGSARSTPCCSPASARRRSRRGCRPRGRRSSSSPTRSTGAASRSRCCQTLRAARDRDAVGRGRGRRRPHRRRRRRCTTASTPTPTSASRGAAGVDAVPLDPNEPSFLIFTSGTESQAQGRRALRRRVPARDVGERALAGRLRAGRRVLGRRRRRLADVPDPGRRRRAGRAA